MKRHSIGRAPDYTNAALVSGGVNLFCLFIGIWVFAGFLPTLLVAIGVNHLITRLSG